SFLIQEWRQVRVRFSNLVIKRRWQHSEMPYILLFEIDINCQPFAAGGSSLSMISGDKGC
ncbi:hypothetical protein, partial [Pseudomonas savastanoi]|uniref:hypothetical protein n=1 Tax=Pseudomonas savastanoi TaxID=29438 RepID=UPI001C814B72